jgi:hypothetical protein
MADLTKKQPHRGVDCKLRLTGANGDLSDLIFAEKISWKPVVEDIETNPITKRYTVHHTFLNGYDIELSGVKKGNDLVQFWKRQAQRDAQGKQIEKIRAVLKYKDPDTGAEETLNLKGVSFMDPDAIEAGGGKEKVEQGIKLHSEEME